MSEFGQRLHETTGGAGPGKPATSGAPGSTNLQAPASRRRATAASVAQAAPDRRENCRSALEPHCGYPGRPAPGLEPAHQPPASAQGRPLGGSPVALSASGRFGGCRSHRFWSAFLLSVLPGLLDWLGQPSPGAKPPFSHRIVALSYPARIALRQPGQPLLPADLAAGARRLV